MQRHSWDQMSWEAVTQEVSRKVVNGKSITVAQIDLKKGAVVPKHAHVNEQVTLLIRGSLRFRIGDEEQVLRPGDVLVTPPNAPHRVTALEDSLAIDIFSPIRQDWIDHTDDYFHRKDG
jgi:quercetin dioxygenase-like cupin family protein